MSFFEKFIQPLSAVLFRREAHPRSSSEERQQALKKRINKGSNDRRLGEEQQHAKGQQQNEQRQEEPLSMTGKVLQHLDEGRQQASSVRAILQEGTGPLGLSAADPSRSILPTDCRNVAPGMRQPGQRGQQNKIDAGQQSRKVKMSELAHDALKQGRRSGKAQGTGNARQQDERPPKTERQVESVGVRFSNEIAEPAVQSGGRADDLAEGRAAADIFLEQAHPERLHVSV